MHLQEGRLQLQFRIIEKDLHAFLWYLDQIQLQSNIW